MKQPKATEITTSYIWRELTDEGRLVDPDDRTMFGERLNSYGGYNSEEEAMSAFLEHSDLYLGELVLLKVCKRHFDTGLWQ
jgi:hypothetical protein